MKYLALLFLPVLLAAGCSNTNSVNSDYGSDSSSQVREYNSSSSSSEEYSSGSSEEETLYYNGYECTDDCSGHEAGYNWAEENDIDDEYDCDGNSNSFNEGCISYVEENY